MGTNTRTHGANARQIDWAERDRLDRRGHDQAPGWLPLDDLDDVQNVFHNADIPAELQEGS